MNWGNYGLLYNERRIWSRLIEIEAMQKVLMEGTEAYDKMQDDLILAKDRKAILLEMIERSELNRPLLPILDENIVNAHKSHQAKDGGSKRKKSLFLTFVLGGPGSGKGSQCEKIVDTFGFTHLSAGDLLRREISLKTEHGAMILDAIKEGKIAPSHVTVNLIQKEIESSDNYKFLIDGFPRSDENRIAFERMMGREPDLVIFFDCPEEEMVRRVLSRNQGRVDDNIETVKKRLIVFHETNLPIVNYYSKKGKLYKVNAVGTVDEIFEQARTIFSAYELPKMLSRFY